MRTTNQAYLDLMETIQFRESNPYRRVKAGITRIPIEKLHVKKGYTCKINDILDFCKKMEKGEELEPIEVNQNNMIIDGVKRYYACKRLKYNNIQVKAKEVFVEKFVGERFKIIK